MRWFGTAAPGSALIFSRARYSYQGRTASDVLDLNPAPIVSLRKLALWFANPYLETGVGQPCPWQGVDRVRELPSLLTPGSTQVDDLKECLEATVRVSIGDHEHVALSYSGGLDSLVLLQCLLKACAQSGRRLTLVTWDLRDQLGRSTADLVLSQVQILQLPTPIILPIDHSDTASPRWSTAGPRTDYYLALEQRTAEVLERCGATAILSGTGGDEVLSAWHFGTSSLLRARRMRAAVRYVSDFARHDSLVDGLAEIVGLAERLLNGDKRARAYLAMQWTSCARALPAEIVREPYAAYAIHEHKHWIRKRRDDFVQLQQSFATAEFWDQVFPYACDVLDADSPIRHVAPFLNAEFVQFVSGLPWELRYDDHARTAYRRLKALHGRLLTAPALAAAPLYKQSYRNAYSEHMAATLKPPTALFEAGVLRQLDVSSLERLHACLPAAVRNVDSWLRGAVERGYQLSPDL